MGASTLGRGRDLQKSGSGLQQLVGSIYSSPILDMSNDNNTTSDQQSVIVATDENQAVIKGALRASGIADFTPKEENMSINSSEGEQATDLDDNWLSDFEMVINTSTMNNNINMDKYLSHKNLQNQQQMLQHQQSTEIDNEEFDSY